MDNNTLVRDAKYCTVHAAARMLGNERGYLTLLKRAKSGDIPGTWRVGKMILIPQAWVDAQIKTKEELPSFLA